MIPSGLVSCRMWDMLYVCDRMRLDEREQLLSLTGGKEYNAEVAANGLWNVPGPRFALFDLVSKLPMLVAGYEEIIPGVWEAWMAMTQDAWARHWITITKATRWGIEDRIAHGARRVQMTCLSKRVDAMHWYQRFLKMQHEGDRMNYTQSGESVSMFARVAA